MANDTPTFRSFSQMLEMHEDGQLNEDLTSLMSTINNTMKEFVEDYGGKHEATLSLKFKFKAHKGVVETTAEIDHKLPKMPRTSNQLWMTDKGFTPENPKQMKLGFAQPRVVDDQSGEVRTV